MGLWKLTECALRSTVICPRAELHVGNISIVQLNNIKSCLYPVCTPYIRYEVVCHDARTFSLQSLERIWIQGIRLGDVQPYSSASLITNQLL